MVLEKVLWPGRGRFVVGHPLRGEKRTPPKKDRSERWITIGGRGVGIGGLPHQCAGNPRKEEKKQSVKGRRGLWEQAHEGAPEPPGERRGKGYRERRRGRR